MQLSALRSRALVLLNDPNSGYYSATNLNNWANDGLDTIIAETETIQGWKTLSSVQYQNEYSLPGDCIKPHTVYWEDDFLKPMDWDEYIVRHAKEDLFTRADPERFVCWNNKLYLYPVPDADATSATLSVATSAASTTIRVGSTSDYPDNGRFIVGSEVISYTNKTATKFTGCTRAMENTSATAHSAAAALTERDITVLYYGAQNAAMSADADTPSIPSRFHILIVYYMVWMGFLASKNIKQAREYERLFAQGLGVMKNRQELDKGKLRYSVIKNTQKYDYAD